MPNKNGTGPEEKGPKTGRSLGSCGNGSPRTEGRGRGRGRGFGRGLGLRRNVERTNKEN